MDEDREIRTDRRREVRLVRERMDSVATEVEGEVLGVVVDSVGRRLRLEIGGEVRDRRWEVVVMVDIEEEEGGRIEGCGVLERPRATRPETGPCGQRHELRGSKESTKVVKAV